LAGAVRRIWAAALRAVLARRREVVSRLPPRWGLRAGRPRLRQGWGAEPQREISSRQISYRASRGPPRRRREGAGGPCPGARQRPMAGSGPPRRGWPCRRPLAPTLHRLLLPWGRSQSAARTGNTPSQYPTAALHGSLRVLTATSGLRR